MSKKGPGTRSALSGEGAQAGPTFSYLFKSCTFLGLESLIAHLFRMKTIKDILLRLAYYGGWGCP